MVIGVPHFCPTRRDRREIAPSIAHVSDRARLIRKLEKRFGLPKELGEDHVDEWSSFEATPEHGRPSVGHFRWWVARA